MALATVLPLSAAAGRICEGKATTKRFTTYYNVQAPLRTVDAGRTIFHVR